MAKIRAPSPSDQALWAAFTETILPLPGKIRPVVSGAPSTTAPATASIPHPPPSAPAPAKPRPAASGRISIGAAPAGLDKATWAKFAGGKMRATSRLDLHGHTATRAHHAVTNFIVTAHAAQLRCVEIITGRGEVLARELPHWLNTPNLHPLILATAHPHAANPGSVRILLRRLR